MIRRPIPMRPAYGGPGRVTRVDENTPGAKGRKTPSRKEAEEARKRAMKTPMTRKEQMKRVRRGRRSASVSRRR